MEYVKKKHVRKADTLQHGYARVVQSRGRSQPFDVDDQHSAFRSKRKLMADASSEAMTMGTCVSKCRNTPAFCRCASA